MYCICSALEQTTIAQRCTVSTPTTVRCLSIELSVVLICLRIHYTYLFSLWQTCGLQNLREERKSYFTKDIQGGPKVRRQTATTHGGGLGESFEVGKSCPETHRYAPVSTFLERLNVRLAIPHSSGQRARSEMRLSLASFRSHGVCQCSSMVPNRPKGVSRTIGRGFKSAVISRFFFIFLFPF